MAIALSDIDLIDRRVKPAILRVREDARKELRRFTGEAAKQGALGAGRFHLQIAEQFIAEHRKSAGTVWAAVREVLDSASAELSPFDADALKQLLLDRVTAIWKQLEFDLEKALKPHGALGGHLARLGESHRLLMDELYSEVDLYLRRTSAKPSSTTVAGDPPDELTKLPLRKALTADLGEAFGSAATVDQPVSIAMVDVDKFKAVNDTHGHLRGDEVLAEVAMRLMTAVRYKGTVYRYGGEEFLVLLRNADVLEASVIAERARKAIEGRPVGGLAITVSIGLATAPTHCSAPDELMKLADGALYDAKNRGRNLVRVHGDPEPAAKKKDPVRRQPMPGGYSSEEAEQIRHEYFATRRARCPKDGALLMVKKLQALGQATPMLFVHCELCGLNEQI